MNEHEKRVQLAEEAKQRAEIEFKAVAHLPAGTPARKQKLKKFHDAHLKANVQKLLPGHNADRVDAFIEKLEEALKKYPKEQFYIFVTGAAWTVAQQNFKPEPAVFAEIRREVDQAIRHIESALPTIKDIYPKLRVVSDDLKKIRNTFPPVSPKGRPPANKDYLVSEIARLFKLLYEQPTHLPSEPFYKVVQIVRNFAKLANKRPDKTVAEAVKMTKEFNKEHPESLRRRP